MYRVLLPVDESIERARRQANYVISLPGATTDITVSVVFVKEEDYEGARPLKLEDVDSAMEALDMLESADVDCEGAVRKGMITKTILEAADELAVDTIVVGGRKRSGVSKVVLGSTTHDLLRSTDLPVTVVG